MHIRTL